MSALNLYHDLHKQNVDLYIENGKLKAKGLLTDSLRAEIAANKSELIEILEGVLCVSCKHYKKFSPVGRNENYCEKYEGLICPNTKSFCGYYFPLAPIERICSNCSHRNISTPSGVKCEIFDWVVDSKAEICSNFEFCPNFF
jgi:hypothetical protein